MLTSLTTENQTSCPTFNESKRERFSNDLNLVVALSVIAVVTDVFTVLFNLTLIIALWRYKKTCRNNQITKTIVTSMAVADLFQSLFSAQPGLLLLITNGQWNLGLIMFFSWNAYAYYLGCTSACHIFSMALDKYLAICHPTKYRILPDKLGYVMVFLSWLIPMVIEVIMYLLMKEAFQDINFDDDCFDGYILKDLENSFVIIASTFASAFLVTPIVFSYFLYFFISIEIHQWIHRTRKFLNIENKPRNKSSSDELGILQPTVFKISQVLVLSSLQEHSHGKTKEVSATVQNYKTLGGRRNLKAIRTIGSIVLTFTMCWFPSIILLILMSRQIQISIQFYIIVLLIGYLNNTLNPLLCLGIGFIRQALRDLWLI
ncbi:beta-3 adrenergic receptor [Biomphalaria glabrata]|nr:beta-3 adrenergic receptor-like [Biomphalaria glabrata]